MATAKPQTLMAYQLNAVTGLETIREFTSDELAQRELDAAEAAAQQAEADAKAAARESALAKLADLGLTAEEIAAL
jgi:DNA-binding NarL/FixJ family response regulator